MNQMSEHKQEESVGRRRPDWLHPQWVKRLLQVVLIMAIVFAGVFFVVTRANALCTPSTSEPTCPTPTQFQNKYNTGFFTHASGVPDRVLNTPGRDHDVFVNHYVRYFNNHPGFQDDMLAFASRVARNRQVLNASIQMNRSSAQRAGATASKGTCLFPLTPSCAATLVWAQMIIRTTCMGWHTWPNLTIPASCNRGRDPCNNFDACTKGITFQEFADGLVLVGCTTGAVGAVGAAVVSGGTATPFVWFSAAGAATGCAAAAAELAAN